MGMDFVTFFCTLSHIVLKSPVNFYGEPRCWQEKKPRFFLVLRYLSDVFFLEELFYFIKYWNLAIEVAEQD